MIIKLLVFPILGYATIINMLITDSIYSYNDKHFSSQPMGFFPLWKKRNNTSTF